MHIAKNARKKERKRGNMTDLQAAAGTKRWREEEETHRRRESFVCEGAPVSRFNDEQRRGSAHVVQHSASLNRKITLSPQLHLHF